MTYEERQRYRELRERLDDLREEWAAGDPETPLTRAEAQRLLDLVEAALERVSPESWDNLMEVIATEITRRVGGMPSAL